jgi:exonuclease SbcD
MSFPEEACYVALGHLHRPQEMNGPRDIRVRYSGSLLQYSFSEAGQEKGVTIVEIDGGKTSYRIIPLGSGRTLEKWRVDGGIEELERRLAEVDPNSWLWVNVAVDEPLPLEYTAKLRKAHPGIIHCMPVYRQDERPDDGAPSISSLPLDEQFRHFIQDRYKEPCSDDVLKLFLELVAGGEEESDEE